MISRVYLDTNAFIAAFEYVGETPSPVWRVLNWIEEGQVRAFTIEITLAELLPKLIVNGETKLIALCEQLFLGNRVFQAVPVTITILKASARVRAQRTSVKLPDAIHLATALSVGCGAILSNDRHLATAGGPPLVAIDDTSVSILQSMGN